MNDVAMGLRLDLSQVTFGTPEVGLVGIIGPMLSKTSGALQGGKLLDKSYIDLEFARRTEGGPELHAVKSEIIADKTDRNAGVISFVTIGEVEIGAKYRYLVVVVKHQLCANDEAWIITKAYLSPAFELDNRDETVDELWRQKAVDLLD